jgi:hypothetical protein
MRYVVKAMLLALACVAMASAAQAADWAWTFIEPGSGVLIRSGTAEVERTRKPGHGSPARAGQGSLHAQRATARWQAQRR